MDGRFVDEKNGAVEAPSMFLPQPPSSVNAHPAWMSSESSRMRKRQRFRRAAIFTTGGLMVIYLLLCSWIAYEHTNYGDASLEGGFPHGKFPWPFPRHPPKRPHPHPPPHHPHHPFPHPVPNVLGCKAIPTLSDDESSATVKLDVTIPKWRPVAFSGVFLRGNISISKIPEEAKEEVVEMENWMEEDLSEGKEVKVHITVVNRTEPKFPPHPPHHRRGEDEETEEGGDGDEESEDKGFLLCAVSFSFPHHPPPPPPDFEGPADGDVLVHPPPPHPHRRPPPPVDIGIFPAYNETYPEFPFPGPPGHPPHSLPPHHFEMTDFEGTSYGSHRSTFKGALRSIVSFLFPMFSSSSEQGQFPQHHHHHHHHPPGPPRSGDKCPHGHRRHFPPPPPFEVVALEASVPASVHVIYGLPPPPPFFHPHPPHHPPPHEHPLQSFAPISD